MWDRFVSSEKLMRLRISPRCWRLLNKASIPPENLKKFYRTYRLPEDPFFPLFLAVKSRWIHSREQWKIDREAAILSRMKALPKIRKKELRVLAEFEEKHNAGKDRPVWENKLYPSTKKRVEEILKLNDEGWYQLFESHLRELSTRYATIPDPADREATNETDAQRSNISARLLARLVLELPENKDRDISRSYRRLSKTLHPDTGGDASAFRHLKEARDILLNDRNGS